LPRPSPRLCTHLLILLALVPAVCAAKGTNARVQAAPVPAEMRSSFFAVTVNGRSVDVALAASNYDFVNFDTDGPVEISITAAEPGFWDRGVDIEPWRLGLRAARDGQTIRFQLPRPAKLSISRPGDFLNNAKMLFLFADAPTPPPPTGPNVTIIPAGIHHGSLNPKSGDTIYLAPGAYIFGGLNLWNVQNVEVLGRGTIVYEGPQNPATDEGWMQKPDWHCIGAYQAHNVEIDGFTCIVRSRTWSIQMKDSTGFRFNDLRVIGGNPGNANQDGMDWLGGGDTIVRDAFIRSSDDDLAVEGNWDGYTQPDMLRPGGDVNDILVEDSELSTSISNIVRINWPQKLFNSRNFTLRNSDILHAGIGACGQTFGLLGLWGVDGARGDHSDITLEDLFLDNWYSLAQIEQAQPAVHDVVLRNIWALGQPPLAASTITGDVKDVTLDNIKYGQTRATSDAAVPLTVSGGAEEPKFVPKFAPKFAPVPPLSAEFTVAQPFIEPRKKMAFEARAIHGARYTWIFGDGSIAHGQHVHHRFPDANGTELDGSNGAGIFRVLLHVSYSAGHQDWATQNIVAVAQWHNAMQPPKASAPVAIHGPISGPLPGLSWSVYAGSWTTLPDLYNLHPVLTGVSPDVQATAGGFTQWATAWDGLLKVPADGGYIFHLIDRDGARLVIDGVEIAKTGPPFAQVCGSPGNALRYNRGAIGLRAGLHTIRIEGLNTASIGAPRLLWEGPGIMLQEIPPTAFSQRAD
jgi:hypothetical protein